jgi:hypothetical protein
MINTVKRCLLIFMLALAPLHSIGAESGSKFLFGIGTGWSFALGKEFARESYAHASYDCSLNIHFGGYIQYNLDDRLGLQLNVNFQNGANHWIFYDWGTPVDSGTDVFNIFFINLNAVFNARRSKHTQIFVLVGTGLATGNKLDYFNGGYLNVAGGIGIKIFKSPNAQKAVLLEATFHHLWDPKSYGGSAGDDFIRLTIGYETDLRRP